MTVNRRLRRPLVVLGVMLSLLVGAASIRAAAAWTAASAPLAERPPSVESLRADLATEQARSRSLQVHLDQLNADSADLLSALASARDRIEADAAQANDLQVSLAAAKAKLAALEISIAKGAVARGSAPAVRQQGAASPEDDDHAGDDYEATDND